MKSLSLLILLKIQMEGSNDRVGILNARLPNISKHLDLGGTVWEHVSYCYPQT